MSVLTANPVAKDILRVFPATLMGILFGIPFGVIAAVYQGRWPDHILRVLSLFGYSVPVFWLGLAGLLIFYGKLGIVPGPGRLDVFYEVLLHQLTA
jgi:peptide/nickel transport system permease protein